MTELLYQKDSYTKEFDAKVDSVLQTERAIVLNRTAFYPGCLLYTSPSPRDRQKSRMPSSA